MPRPPLPGMKWASVELPEDVFEIFSVAAKADERALTVYLRRLLTQEATLLKAAQEARAEELARFEALAPEMHQRILQAIRERLEVERNAIRQRNQDLERNRIEKDSTPQKKDRSQ